MKIKRIANNGDIKIYTHLEAVLKGNQDTYQGTCRICEEHTDLILGVCEDCSQEAEDELDAEREEMGDQARNGGDR